MAKKTIEAEGRELVLQNKSGDTIIIPKNKREEVLKHLKDGNHKAIDEIASSLPYMEDYAEDGTLIPDVVIEQPKNNMEEINAANGITVTGNPEDGKPTKKSSFSAIYDKEGVESLYDRYGSGEMASFADYGCLGSTCRNIEKLYPDIPSYYEELEKAGVYQGQGINTSFENVLKDRKERAKQANTVGVDSWELPYVMEDYKLGKSLFLNDPDTYDPEFIRNYDYSKLPVGTILSSGDARGVYVDKDAKSYRGKKEPLYRHSVSVAGYAEGEDLSGNPAVDLIIDENGTIKRIGKSKDAEYTWEDYSTGTKGALHPIHAATVRNSTEKYNYDYFKSQQSEEDIKAAKNKTLTKEFKEEAAKLEADIVDGKIKPGTNKYLLAMAKLKTLDKTKEKEKEQ